MTTKKSVYVCDTCAKESETTKGWSSLTLEPRHSSYQGRKEADFCSRACEAQWVEVNVLDREVNAEILREKEEGLRPDLAKEIADLKTAHQTELNALRGEAANLRGELASRKAVREEVAAIFRDMAKIVTPPERTEPALDVHTRPYPPRTAPATNRGEFERVQAVSGIRIVQGIYTVYWKDGGLSTAAVGCDQAGRFWLAPTNWLSVGMTDAWKLVERVVTRIVTDLS